MLFDDEPGESAQPAAAPVAGPAPTAFSAPSSGKWPGTIPPLDMARAVMMGRVGVPPAFQTLTESLKARMTPVENAVLSGQPVAFDPAGLLNAIGMRWRIKVAIATRPAKDDQIDQQLVDVFLGEIDVAMKGIAQIPEGIDAPGKAAFDANKDALARAAMEVLSATPSSPNIPVVAVPPGEPVVQKKQATAGKIRITEEVPVAKGASWSREKKLRVAIALMLPVAIFINAGALLGGRSTTIVDGMPENSRPVAAKDGSAITAQFGDTKPSAADIAMMKAKAAGMGKKLFKLPGEGRGWSYIICSPSMVPSLTETNDNGD